MNNASASAGGIDNAVGAGQAYFFSVMMPEVKLNAETRIAFATDLEKVFFVEIGGNRGLFDRIAGWADNSCRVIWSDKNFEVFHEISHK